MLGTLMLVIPTPKHSHSKNVHSSIRTAKNNEQPLCMSIVWLPQQEGHAKHAIAKSKNSHNVHDHAGRAHPQAFPKQREPCQAYHSKTAHAKHGHSKMQGTPIPYTPMLGAPIPKHATARMPTPSRPTARMSTPSRPTARTSSPCTRSMPRVVCTPKSSAINIFLVKCQLQIKLLNLVISYPGTVQCTRHTNKNRKSKFCLRNFFPFDEKTFPLQ